PVPPGGGGPGMSGPRRLRPGLPALAALALLVAPAPAQRVSRSPVPFAEQTHVLRRILFDQNFAPLQSLDGAADRPSHTALIVLGDLRPLVDLPGGLRKFLDDGGAVLAASDSMTQPLEVRQALRGVTGYSLPYTGQARVEVRGPVDHLGKPQGCFRGFVD